MKGKKNQSGDRLELSPAQRKAVRRIVAQSCGPSFVGERIDELLRSGRIDQRRIDEQAARILKGILQERGFVERAIRTHASSRALSGWLGFVWELATPEEEERGRRMIKRASREMGDSIKCEPGVLTDEERKRQFRHLIYTDIMRWRPIVESLFNQRSTNDEDGWRIVVHNFCLEERQIQGLEQGARLRLYAYLLKSKNVLAGSIAIVAVLSGRSPKTIKARYTEYLRMTR